MSAGNGRAGPDLSLVPEPPSERGPILDIALISDRLGWEEKAIVESARARDAGIEWLDDGDLCCGSREDLPPAITYLIRSRSFVRGPLIAESLGNAADRRVVNPAPAIARCSNKVATAALLRRHGIATVPYRLILSRRDIASAVGVFGLPLVLKPVFGGLGRRVVLIRELATADGIYDYVEHYGQNYDRALIAQPFLEGASDVRVLALGGDALAAVERVPAGDWRANVELGAAAEPIEIDARLRRLTAEIAERIDAPILGIDLFRWDGELIVGEVNHSPLFRGMAEATGLDIAGRIVDHLLTMRVTGGAS